MIRSIVSKLIILLIVLFCALSIFWFFKTSSIKKQVTSLIRSSEGSVLASSFSVTGFPLSQKLVIEDLKIKISPFSAIPNSNSFNIIERDEYEITIKKLEAVSGIFSNDFAANVSDEISFQDSKGVNSLKFNQPPKINFVLGKIAKFSYQDSGYKIVNASQKVLFENGESIVVFESTSQGEKSFHKLKADFKDIGALSFNNDISENITIVDKDNLKKFTPSFGANKLVKKSLKLNVEFVSKNPPEVLPINPILEAEDNNYEIESINNGPTLESLKINNIEIFSPLYKLSFNGQINSFPKKDLPIGSVSLRIEKLDNILIYLKKYLAELGFSSYSGQNIEVDKNLNNSDNGVVLAEEESAVDEEGSVLLRTMSQDEVSDLNGQLEEDSEAKEINIEAEPKIDITDAIRNLSKKNLATNEEIAIFDFRKEKDLALVVNEISLIDIIMEMLGGLIDVDVNTNIPDRNEEDPIIDSASPLFGDEIMMENQDDINFDKNTTPEIIITPEIKRLKPGVNEVEGAVENAVLELPEIQNEESPKNSPITISEPDLLIPGLDQDLSKDTKSSFNQGVAAEPVNSPIPNQPVDAN
jgi:hypothetical protein